MGTRYENGKTAVLRHALECAIRDREGMLDSLRCTISNFYGYPREEALAKLLPSDREYYLEIEAWLRDFQKMAATVERTEG